MLWQASRPPDDTYSGDLLAYTSGTASDEDDLARHIWYVRSCELGTTGEDVIVDDSAESCHVGCETMKRSSFQGEEDELMYRQFVHENEYIGNCLGTAACRRSDAERRNGYSGGHRGICGPGVGSMKTLMGERIMGP